MAEKRKMPAHRRESPDRGSPTQPFGYGAIAFLDALGWKGMWRRRGVDARAMISALRALRDVAAPLAERIDNALRKLNDVPPGLRALFPGAHVRALALSDTVVVAASFDHRKNAADNEFLREAASPMLQRAVMDVVQRVYQSAALGPVPLAFRGAVAVGELLVEESFLVGPAVDRCAELMSLPEAACVFLDPAAPSWNSDHCFSYELELKGVGRLEVPVVNPLGGCAPDRARLVTEGVLRAFGDPTDLGVLKKKQNTFDLFRRARQDVRPERTSADTSEKRMGAVFAAGDYANTLLRASQAESPEPGVARKKLGPKSLRGRLRR
jgi:hypothetical protein